MDTVDDRLVAAVMAAMRCASGHELTCGEVAVDVGSPDSFGQLTVAAMSPQLWGVVREALDRVGAHVVVCGSRSSD